MAYAVTCFSTPATLHDPSLETPKNTASIFASVQYRATKTEITPSSTAETLHASVVATLSPITVPEIVITPSSEFVPLCARRAAPRVTSLHVSGTRYAKKLTGQTETTISSPRARLVQLGPHSVHIDTTIDVRGMERSPTFSEAFADAEYAVAPNGLGITASPNPALRRSHTVDYLYSPSAYSTTSRISTQSKSSPTSIGSSHRRFPRVAHLRRASTGLNLSLMRQASTLSKGNGKGPYDTETILATLENMTSNAPDHPIGLHHPAITFLRKLNNEPKGNAESKITNAKKPLSALASFSRKLGNNIKDASLSRYDTPNGNSRSNGLFNTDKPLPASPHLYPRPPEAPHTGTLAKLCRIFPTENMYGIQSLLATCIALHYVNSLPTSPAPSEADTQSLKTQTGNGFENAPRKARMLLGMQRVVSSAAAAVAGVLPGEAPQDWERVQALREVLQRLARARVVDLMGGESEKAVAVVGVAVYELVGCLEGYVVEE
ncbi:hypothetical protein MMC25_001981 [Agyrium rufum]|nr:hypothetical protein [Agyrium rufum]